jgi:hypothetical protein
MTTYQIHETPIGTRWSRYILDLLFYVFMPRGCVRNPNHLFCRRSYNFVITKRLTYLEAVGDPDPLVRSTDPDPAPDPDLAITKQK